METVIDWNIKAGGGGADWSAWVNWSDLPETVKGQVHKHWDVLYIVHVFFRYYVCSSVLA